MGKTICIGLAFGLLLAACGGGGGNPSAPSMPATTPSPTHLTATYESAKSEVSLTWLAPNGSIDGYNLEGGFHDGGFSQINQNLIPRTAVGATITFDPRPVELSRLDFRVCAVRNGISSLYSNIATCTVPLDPPRNLKAVFSSTDGGVKVSWENASLVAEGCLLERAFCDVSGNPSGPWITLQLPSLKATGFIDQDVSEFSSYVYRVSAWKGGDSSLKTAPSPKIDIPLLAPGDFSARSKTSAVELTWVNRSRAATLIQITRFTPQTSLTKTIATLSATAISYVDENLPLGYYSYRITALSSGQSASAPTVVGSPANPPGGPALTPTALSPNSQVAMSALSPTGLWALGQTNPITVFAAPWGTWQEWASRLLSTSLFPEPMKLDSISLPHLVYREQIGPSNSLMHTWFDGSEWMTAVIRELPGPDSSVLATSFCLDKNNNPVVLHDLGMGSTGVENLAYSHKVGDTWLHEKFQNAPTGALNSQWPRLFLDPSGAPHVLLRTWSNMLEYTRSEAGTWNYHVLLNTTPTDGMITFEDGIWQDAGNATVFYQKFESEGEAFWILQKTNGTWQPPLRLKTFSRVAESRVSVASSADGTRVAAVCYTMNGLVLFTRTGIGWVESLVPIPEINLPYFKVGFDSGNRLHILVRPSAFKTDVFDLHE